MKKPSILITNDDGINAPGIKHLWESLKKIAHVTVVAPSQEQSAVGLSITLRQPLRVDPIHHFPESTAYSVSGTPADCVKMALSAIMDAPPDLIVSGINCGANSGRNLFYSGTVAGCIEGIMHDIPSIAFSCFDHHDPNYDVAAKFVPSVIDHILSHPLPKGTLLNVNFPTKHAPIKGFKMTRQGQGCWMENPEKRAHPHAPSHYYWLGAKVGVFPEHEDTDVRWLDQGYITAVPVYVGELTHHEQVAARKQAFENMKLSH